MNDYEDAFDLEIRYFLKLSSKSIDFMAHLRI